MNETRIDPSARSLAEPASQVQAYGKTPVKGRSGGWMIRCHNQEHSESGMMTCLELREPRSRKGYTTTS